MSRTAAVSERAFQDAIIETARIYGWRLAHFRPARTTRGWATAMQGDVGFPDLVLARGGRVVFAELKSDTGKITSDQSAWLDALSAGGCVETYVFRPDDWDRAVDVLR